jgi:hypothetical protein
MYLFYKSERYMCAECEAKFFLPFVMTALMELKRQFMRRVLFWDIIFLFSGLLSYLIIAGPDLIFMGIKYRLK